MEFRYACLTLQRIVLPFVLVLAALYRPVGISFVYLLMFFISPYIPVATAQNFKGSATAHLIILIALSTILLLCHIALQVAIATLDLGDVFGTCSFTEQLLRHIGFIDFKNLKAYAVVDWLVPEVVVFVTSIAIYLVVKKISAKGPAALVESGEGTALDQDTTDSAADGLVPPRTKTMSETKFNFAPLVKIAPMCCLSTIFFSAILRPSVPGGIYFLFFLLSGSYWATFTSLKRGFAILTRGLMIILVVHIMLLVSYQTPWMQQNIGDNTLVARLIGLEPLIKSTCSDDIRYFTYETSFKLDSFLNPITMLFSYYVLALTSKNLIKMKLVRHKKPIRTHGDTGSHATSSVSDIPLSDIQPTSEQETAASLWDQVYYGFVSVGGFIYQNSYIFTNILMMAWSIVYHSWLTFVLLLWANVLWMIPNQRKAMMRSSPFIVLYAELLLIAQYIYGMNLTNDELPSSVNTTGINLKQIGLERPMDNNIQPCVPLLVKTTFLLMFWVTLRQFFKEKLERKRHSTIADMVAPLQVTVGTATADLQGADAHKKTSKFLKKAGDIFKNLLVRLWIWLLILVIFLCAITGVKMTGFRICYMALFLFFLLVFQTSSKAWMKVMYGFWLFLIFYAMSILTLIYTYQFDKFDQYWYDYLNISKTLQQDIGLKKYETKELFLHLVSPTIIVILTAIQVHYFHRRFIAALRNAAEHGEGQQNGFTEPNLMNQSETNTDTMPKSSRTKSFDYNQSIKDLLQRFMTECKNKTKNIGRTLKGACWRFLELHLIKAVYISAFVCCVKEICVLHITLCVLCVIGIITTSRARMFISRVISLVVSVIILAKMIYQVQYISHEQYDVKCNGTDEIKNNAVWFGLQKATVYGGLIHLIKKYIIFMVMVTLHAVVKLRQYQMRCMQGIEKSKTDRVTFPGVTRADAEKNLEGMVKYLFNYAFYKFGMECTLVTLVGMIVYRQDVVAIVYVGWLCILLSLKRSSCARIWGIFQCSTATFIILEFLVLVQPPPGLCVEYPWCGLSISHALHRWGMLPGNIEPYSHVNKLIFEYILLMFINRQKRVFTIESRSNPQNVYPGGSNESVVDDIDKLGHVKFENPTRDFLSTIRDYLDVLKNGFLCGFYWVTLAVVYLAGTNTADLLAVGYLIGAFIFLWQGTDFYLRPIRVIIFRWNLLLLYTVFNIAMKTVLQIGGCLFMPWLQMNTCWLVHVLGIICAKASKESQVDDEVSECPALREHPYLVWDAICFACILVQMRIFQSYYFCHIINDTKANTLLAYRGAEIIEDLRQKQIEHRKQHEQEVLRKIKRKMEKIRATQQKMLRPIDRPTHFDEHGSPILGAKPYKRKDFKYHAEAIRAGDYYMFDDMDEKFELDLIDDEVDFLADQGKIDQSEMKMTRRQNLFEHDKQEKERHEKQAHEKAGTSKDLPSEEGDGIKRPSEEGSTESEEEEPNPILRLMEAFMVTVVVHLNRLSRNYRYVMKIVGEEKKMLKELNAFEPCGSPSQMDPNNPEQLPNRQIQTIRCSLSDDEASVSNAQNSQSNTEIHDTDTTTTTAVLHQPLVDINEIQLDTVDAPLRKSYESQSSLVRASGSEDFTYEDDFVSQDHNIVIEAMISTYYAIIANTDVICYIFVFVNQVVNASIISLPLPLMVFLWGTLSLPRPSKTFWVTLLAYTQLLIVVKCVFQFKLIWANHINLPNQPLALGKIIGVGLENYYTNYDLLLLLVLFFHRFILKTQGLWKSEYKSEVMLQHAITLKDDKPRNNDMLAIRDEQQPDEEMNDESSDDPRNSKRNSVEYVAILTKNKYFSSCKKFFYGLVQKTRLPADVYALMFMCDFINFFVLLFGFTAFGSQQHESGGGVQTYLEENKVPIPFLIMLLLQFILIVIDRALYLRKALVKKIIFHFFSVIGIHIWMFFVIPAVTERSFYTLAPPIIFYIVKCFYLLLSSYQIKCGYPKRILGNFLTKGFSLVNMVTFKTYMQVPFLFELRTILDWVCTDTTMTLFDWLKMEDIFSDIFFIKCARQLETDFPAARATKKAWFVKMLLGGTIILMIVIAIWGPLCLFALGNAVGQSNTPYEVTLSIRIGPYDPIYSTSNRESIYTLSASQYSQLQSPFRKDRSAITFMSNYDSGDVAAFVLKGNSPSFWAISPPDKERMLEDLETGKTLTCRFTYSFARVPPTKGGQGTVHDEVTYDLTQDFEGRADMIALLRGTAAENTVIVIPGLMPKFLKVLNSGELYSVSKLITDEENHRPLVITLHNRENSQGVWWEIRELCEGPFYKNVLQNLPFTNCESGITMFTFNDKKFPSTFSFLTAGGIIGLYTTFVLLASRLLKSFIAGQSRRVMFEDLPYVDRVLQLCLDIYLVREALEFALEEDLFAKLLFLFRSPETLIKWTRPKEEIHDTETDTESQHSRASKASRRVE